MPEARPVPISDLIRGLGSLAVTLIVMLALLFWPAGTLARELPGYAEYMQRVRSVGSRSSGEASAQPPFRFR